MEFFAEVNNINIFGFTKTIVNMQKLRDDLMALPLSGGDFDFFVANDDQIRIHYKQAQDQSKQTEFNTLINNFQETDMVLTLKGEQSLKSSDGFDLYKFIIADINNRGGLGTIDGGIQQYLGMTNIRHMLKDGFFEYALRYFALYLAPAFSQEQQDLYMAKMEALALKYNATTGTSQAVLDLIKTLPEGSI